MFNFIRFKSANIIDSSFTSYDLKFDTIVANKPYYLQDLGKFLFEQRVITNLQLLPYSAVLINNKYNQLAPLDYSKFYVWLLDSNQRVIFDQIPLVYFSQLGNNVKTRFLSVYGVNMQYSYIVWNGTPLVTSTPLILPFRFTYYNPNQQDYDLRQMGYNRQ